MFSIFTLLKKHIYKKILIIIYISIGYTFFGYVGDSLATQANDATAIWPASGIALASCLIWGRSIWPGIFIGSFIINAWIDFDTTSVPSMIRSSALISTISFGAVLQALAGHFLITRSNSQPNLFQTPHEIFLLFCCSAEARDVLIKLISLN